MNWYTRAFGRENKSDRLYRRVYDKWSYADYVAKEFIYLVDAGMPIMKAIQSATVTNTTLLDMEKQIGVIEPGFLVDVIATELDPTQDINTVFKVVFVIKEGVIYKSN